jgi:penicillin-binding protein 1A
MALVAIRPQTGEIVAMVGGVGGLTLNHQFNRAWQAQRQPGSSFKAYVYTAAIDSGMPATTTIDDSPVTYPNGDGTSYSPMDDDYRFYGPMTLRYALAQSRNVVAVKLAEQLGVDRVIEYAHRMGVRAPLEANLSLALGTSVLSPLDQAAGYATLADQGIHIDPTPIRLVVDSFGSPLLDNRVPQETEVVGAGTAYVMTSMLEGVIKEGTGYPNAEIGRPAAGKTGTTSDFRDAWFVGYTPDLVAAVWLGNDDYTRMNDSFGGNVPARTWARFMKAALANTPKHDFAFPSTEVRKLAYCGQPSKYEYFLDGTEPHASCASAGYAGPAHTASIEPPAGAEPVAARYVPPPYNPPALPPLPAARPVAARGAVGRIADHAAPVPSAPAAGAAAGSAPLHADASGDAVPAVERATLPESSPVPDATAPPADPPPAPDPTATPNDP